VTKKTFKAFFHRLFPLRLLLPLLFFWKGKRSRLASGHGWARSLRRLEPVDETGRPIPWIPYSAVVFLTDRLTSDLSVLELGAGYSTLYFMGRVARVVSLEHDQGWLRRVRGRAAANVRLIQTDASTADSYLAPIRGTDERFDVILIDGPHRIEALSVSLRLLSPSGVILLDDSHRPRYAPAFVYAAAAGMRRLDFEGHKAASVHLYRTTVFYRDGNCLGI
jgi:SAM-dependent methyltransferase